MSRGMRWRHERLWNELLPNSFGVPVRMFSLLTHPCSKIRWPHEFGRSIPPAGFFEESCLPGMAIGDMLCALHFTFTYQDGSCIVGAVCWWQWSLIKMIQLLANKLPYKQTTIFDGELRAFYGYCVYGPLCFQVDNSVAHHAILCGNSGVFAHVVHDVSGKIQQGPVCSREVSEKFEDAVRVVTPSELCALMFQPLTQFWANACKHY